MLAVSPEAGRYGYGPGVQETIFRRNIICVEKKIFYEQHALGVLSILCSMPVKDRTPLESSPY